MLVMCSSFDEYSSEVKSGRLGWSPVHKSDTVGMQECVLLVICSSFDEYSSEVKSGRLEWSPVHKSEKFWHENAARLNEKNFELLKSVK